MSSVSFVGAMVLSHDLTQMFPGDPLVWVGLPKPISIFSLALIPAVFAPLIPTQTVAQDHCVQSIERRVLER